MHDEPLDLTDSKEKMWREGKSESYNTSSTHGMSDERKEIIRRALEFDITDIRTYTGYRGDLLVQITTMKSDAVKSLSETAKNLGFETTIQKDVLSIYKLFCISPSSNIYELK